MAKAPANSKATQARKPPQIISLEESTESANILIYSFPGLGKTVFCADLPKALILACEPGTVSAARMGKKADLWKCPTWDQFIEAKKWLTDNPDHGYTWVVVDTATALQAQAMRWTIDRAMRGGRNNGDIDIPAIQDYQKWYNMFLREIDELNELPVNVCYVAHAMQVENEEGEEQIIPAFMGRAKEGYQISHMFSSKMQLIGFFYIDIEEKKVKDKDTGKRVTKVKKVRKLLIQATPPYTAKDRYNLGADELINPNMKDLSSQILEFVK